MPGEDDEVIVQIGDGAEPEKTPDKTTESADGDPIGDLKSQFTALQRTVQQQQAEKNQALRAASEASQRVEKLETEIAEIGSVNRYDQIAAGLSAAEAEAAQARKDFKAAFESGNSEAATEATDRLTSAKTTIARLTEAKADFDSKPEKTEVRNEAPQRPQTPADPVEAYIQGRTEPTANWLRQHRDYITDPRKNAKLTAAHYNAEAEGLVADTPEYFEHVEKFVGLKSDEPRQRRPAAPTTPVVHTGGGLNGGAREVRLTKGEVAAATDGTHTWNYDDPTGKGRFKKGDPIGVQEFARRKEAMQKEGRYDRAYLEA